MGGCCSKITDALKGIMGSIGKIVAIALLCAAVYFTWFAGPGAIQALAGISWLPATLQAASATGPVWGAVALGAAVLIDSETVTEVVTKAGAAIGNAAAGVVAGVASGLASGLGGSNLLAWVAAAAIAYWFVFVRKSDKRDESTGDTKVSDLPYDASAEQKSLNDRPAASLEYNSSNAPEALEEPNVFGPTYGTV